jgi:hypothetical protein
MYWITHKATTTLTSLLRTLFLNAPPNVDEGQEGVGGSRVKVEIKSMASAEPGKGRSKIQKSQQTTLALVQEAVQEAAGAADAVVEGMVDVVVEGEGKAVPEGVQAVEVAVVVVVQSDWAKGDGLLHAAKRNQSDLYLFHLPNLRGSSATF